MLVIPDSLLYNIIFFAWEKGSREVFRPRAPTGTSNATIAMYSAEDS
jgi:hypothetical protein